MKEKTVFQNTGGRILKEEEFWFSLEALYFSAEEEVAWGEVKGHYFGSKPDAAHFPL